MMTRKLLLAIGTIVTCASMTAQADIESSLQSICEKSSQYDEPQMAAPDVSQNSYESKRARYFTHVSCRGKALIDISHLSDNENTKQLAEQARYE